MTRWRAVAVVGVAVLAAADAGFIRWALHTPTPPRTVLSRSAETVSGLPSVTVVAGASPAAASPADRVTLVTLVTGSGGVVTAIAHPGCGTGTDALRLDGHVGAVPAVAIQSLGTTRDGLLFFAGVDQRCVEGVWQQSVTGAGWWRWALTVPGHGPVAVSDTAVWAWDGRSLERTTAGETWVAGGDPCRSSGLRPTQLVAFSRTTAVVVCAGPRVSVGQARLVYATTTGGQTWSAPAGADRPGAPVAGGGIGLDGDGWLAAVGAAGPTGLSVLLAHTACPGLQLRTSGDLGQTWRTVGCVPLAADPTAASVEQSGATIVAAAAQAGHVTVLRSIDGGRSWQPVP